jgi:hypothetical protein
LPGRSLKSGNGPRTGEERHPNGTSEVAEVLREMRRERR